MGAAEESTKARASETGSQDNKFGNCVSVYSRLLTNEALIMINNSDNPGLLVWQNLLLLL